MATIPATRTPAADHRLDRPRRHVAGDDRQERQADRPSRTTTAATSCCPATRPRCIRVADNPDLAKLRRQDDHHHRRHDAARRRRQGRRRRHHGGGRSTCSTHPEIPHGPIRICFTCDEEIGHGVDHVDLKKLGARRRLHARRHGARARSTARRSPPTWRRSRSRGVNIHPSIAKGRMVNAIRLAGLFLDRLPRTTLSPETTDGREGFLHPYTIEGGVAETTIQHPAARLRHGRSWPSEAELLRAVARTVEAEYPGGEDRRAGRRSSTATWPTAWRRSRGRWRSPRRRCAGPGWSRS